MSTLDGKTIASTFKDLLQVSNNNVGVDDTIRYIEDGEGTITALAISTNMVELSGDLVPAEDVTFDIGSATHRFKDLYLSGNTIYLGDTTFSTADIQAVKSVQDIGVENLPTFSEVATPAQGAKADSAIQPNDSRDLMPANNMTQDIGSAARHWMHVYTHHLSAHENVIVGGEIHGPEILVIDPASIGDNTGKVVIQGDLQVNGESTAVLSTTINVSGKSITLGAGATDATQVDGAGVEVAGSGATISYTSGNDSWNTNKTLIVPTLQSENMVTEQLNVTGNAAVDQMDLTVIEQIKNDQAVAVFIYDTSKDSDGGAWRHRVTHTSWYNEPLNTSTRGNKREFPAVAVIVAEAEKVTIYDGDDPDLPMWMVFVQEGVLTWASSFISTNICVHALNGKFVWGTDQRGGAIADFIKDDIELFHESTERFKLIDSTIGNREDGSWVKNPEGYAGLPVIHPSHRGIAMTVLPNAPIDSDTNLPVPTIAIGTEGGITVIKHDGTVVSKSSEITGYSAHKQVENIMFDGDELVFTNWNNTSQLTLARYTSDLTHKIAEYTSYGSQSYGYDIQLPFKNHMRIYGGFDTKDNKTSLATDAGLVNILENAQTPKDSLLNHVTTTHSTGLVDGATNLITCCDTVSEQIGLPARENFVQNGTFTDGTSAGWTNNNITEPIEIVDGQLALTTTESNRYIYQQVDGLTPGDEYRFSMIATGWARAYISADTDYNNQLVSTGVNNWKTNTGTSVYFNAPDNGTVFVLLYVLDAGTGGNTCYVDNISITNTREMIKNGDFNGGDGWNYTEGSWHFSTSAAHDTPEGVSTDDRLYQTVSVEPGQPYEIGLQIASQFRTADMWFEVRDGDNFETGPKYIQQNYRYAKEGSLTTTTFTPSSDQVTVGIHAYHGDNVDDDVMVYDSGFNGIDPWWETGPNWTIASGLATCTGINSSGYDSRMLTQRNVLTPGRSYRLTVELQGIVAQDVDERFGILFATHNDDVVSSADNNPDMHVLGHITSDTQNGDTFTIEFKAAGRDIIFWTSATGGGQKQFAIDNIVINSIDPSIDNFTMKPTDNMVQNSRFDSVKQVLDQDFAGRYPQWRVENGAEASVDQGFLRVQNAAGSTTTGRLMQHVRTVVGQEYVLRAYGDPFTSGAWGIRKTDDVDGSLTTNPVHETFTYRGYGSIKFVATSEDTYIGLSAGSNTAAEMSRFTDISLRLAEPNRVENAITRSLGSAGVQVIGSITKRPVAPDAELVSYSGFDTDTRLVCTDHELFNFGTGDFCFTFWCKSDVPLGQNYLIQLVESPDGIASGVFPEYDVIANNPVGDYMHFLPVWQSAGGKHLLNLAGDYTYYIDQSEAPVMQLGQWTMWQVGRRDGMLQVYMNGQLSSQHENKYNFTNLLNTLVIGGRFDVRDHNDWPGEIALFRVSKSMATASEIQEIYRQELEMFQPGAKITLHGTTGNVNAVHLDDQHLLHVGTTQGKSVFKDLVRVSHDDTPVTDLIINSNFNIQQ